MKKLQLYVAGILAFLIGMPMTQEAIAQPGGIIRSSLNLAGAITNASSGVR